MRKRDGNGDILMMTVMMVVVVVVVSDDDHTIRLRSQVPTPT